MKQHAGLTPLALHLDVDVELIPGFELHSFYPNDRESALPESLAALSEKPAVVVVLVKLGAGERVPVLAAPLDTLLGNTCEGYDVMDKGDDQERGYREFAVELIRAGNAVRDHVAHVRERHGLPPLVDDVSDAHD